MSEFEDVVRKCFVDKLEPKDDVVGSVRSSALALCASAGSVAKSLLSENVDIDECTRSLTGTLLVLTGMVLRLQAAGGPSLDQMRAEIVEDMQGLFPELFGERKTGGGE